MSFQYIYPETLQFLSDLRQNNNRPWFTDHKDRYQKARENIKDFLKELTERMNQIDHIEKNKLFRIYRDVRFSKDKTPYNTHFSMSMAREKPHLRGGYYLRISPGASVLACGFWNPNPSDLKLIRSNIERNDAPLRNALRNEDIKRFFGDLEGDQVKTAPKGFSKDHPAIDLLRHKQFILTRQFSDKEVCHKGFVDEAVLSYSVARPWFDYMSDILSHDLDGVPLYS